MDHKEKEEWEKIKLGQSLDIPDLVEVKYNEELGDSSGISNCIHKSACTEVYIYCTGTNVNQAEILTSETFIYDSKHQTKATQGLRWQKIYGKLLLVTTYK